MPDLAAPALVPMKLAVKRALRSTDLALDEVGKADLPEDLRRQLSDWLLTAQNALAYSEIVVNGGTLPTTA